MRRSLLALACAATMIATGLIATTRAVQAQTTTPGTPTGTPSTYTEQLYSGPTGTRTVQTPSTVTSGDVVFLTSDTDQSMSNFEGILEFADTSDTTPLGEVTFLTDPSMFSSVTLGSGTVFEDKTAGSLVTPYTAGGATYDAHFSAVGATPGAVPEPASMAAMGIGGLGLLGLIRRQRHLR